MKQIFIPLSLIVSILVLLAIIFVGVTEMNDRDKLKQSEIDHWKKVNKEQADSLNQVLKVTQDSLYVAFETIKQARIEREESHLRTQKTIKDLQRIVFIQHTDSSRNKVLTQLYKTYKP